MFGKLRAKIRRRRADKYAKRLLSVGKDQIRLQDIPESYRLSEDHGLTLHIYTFRADRNISLERYQQDLDFMDVEILLLPDGELKRGMEYVYLNAQSNFDYLKESAR